MYQTATAQLVCNVTPEVEAKLRQSTNEQWKNGMSSEPIAVKKTRRVSTNRTYKQPILCSCDFFRMASTCQDISNLEGNCKGPVIKSLHKS
jgi:hypothetical protein